MCVRVLDVLCLNDIDCLFRYCFYWCEINATMCKPLSFLTTWQVDQSTTRHIPQATRSTNCDDISTSNTKTFNVVRTTRCTVQTSCLACLETVLAENQVGITDYMNIVYVGTHCVCVGRNFWRNSVGDDDRYRLSRSGFETAVKCWSNIVGKFTYTMICNEN